MRFFKTKGFFGEWGYECNFTLNFEIANQANFARTDFVYSNMFLCSAIS